MKFSMLKAKIHSAVVTEANLKYQGSITIDSNLLDESGILEYEKVQVVNCNNGARIETYTFRGEPGSGVICLNGAAARYFEPEDRVIIMAYADMEANEAEDYRPGVVLIGEDNFQYKTGAYTGNGQIEYVAEPELEKTL